MLRRNFLRNLSLTSLISGVPFAATLAKDDDGSTATGVRTITGTVTSGGKGIANVSVSDGFNVAQTDKSGKYSLAPHMNARFIFISLPSGYEIPNQDGIARFYQPLQGTAGAQTANFTLKALGKNDEDHAFIVWADPQIQSADDANQLKTISAPDTRELIKTYGDKPLHGIGCGDLVFDHFELFKDYEAAVATTGIPFFQVLGNHDMDYTTARSDDGSQQEFMKLYGPTYYSFNRGKIHYVVLDDVFFIGMAKKYIGYITEQQLAWLEKDLQTVKPGSTVVVALHIPTNTGAQRRDKSKEEGLGGTVSNREHLYKLLKPFNVHLISGHTHFNENWEKDNIMEHNHGTICGAWWTGPICGDGTPSGYGVYEVKGNDISWYYKSTGLPKTHQLRVYPKDKYAGKPGAIVANVWNWDAKWKVEWLEDGVSKGSMEQFTGLDAWSVELHKGPQLPKKHTWVEPTSTDHLFSAVPAAGAKKITVRATDRFGNVYEESLEM